MGVTQWATPTLTLTFSEQSVDLTQASSVYVTFRSGLNKFTKTGEDLTIAEKSIGVHLSQTETGRFKIGDKLKIQANWMIGGERIPSKVAEIDVDEQLLQEVIT